jgi:SulP family sulfate permease
MAQIQPVSPAKTFAPFLEWLPMLDHAHIRADIIAGLIAGVLILPQAIALATLAELPPEIGLYTSIFPVIICALFGSSWHALAGPNTSLSVMVATVLGAYASPGTPDFIMYAITLTFIVGTIQLAVGFLRLGGIFNYFSNTVMVAIVTGVGIIIIIQQLGSFLGLTVNSGEPVEDTLYNIFHSAHYINIHAAGLGLLTLASGLLSKRYRRHWPHLIIAVAVGLAGSFLLDMLVGSANADIDKLGYLSLAALPLSAPDFSPTNFYEAAEGLLLGGVMIAFLGLMQSVVIARAIAVKSGQHVDINQEVIGNALSNIAGSFLSCYPSCGSFNRSAANYASGARTPLTGIISALALAVLVIFAAPLLAQLPMSVVAGVLLLVGWGLIDLRSIFKLVQVRGEDRVVFLLTVFAAVYGGLEWGVIFGIVLSIITYLRGVSKPEFVVLFDREAKQFIPAGVDNATVVSVSGSLFFGSVPTLERLLTDLGRQDQRSSALIIAGNHIDNMDDAACITLTQEAIKRKRDGGDLYLWLRDHRMDAVLEETGLLAVLGDGNILYLSDLVSDTHDQDAVHAA